jgi:hypothetical protein
VAAYQRRFREAQQAGRRGIRRDGGEPGGDGLVLTPERKALLQVGGCGEPARRRRAKHLKAQGEWNVRLGLIEMQGWGFGELGIRDLVDLRAVLAQARRAVGTRTRRGEASCACQTAFQPAA